MSPFTAKQILTVYESHDGDCWVDLIEAKSRNELSKLVAERNWTDSGGCDVDCTGRVFAASARLLRVVHAPWAWIGVVLNTSARDV